MQLKPYLVWCKKNKTYALSQAIDFQKGTVRYDTSTTKESSGEGVIEMPLKDISLFAPAPVSDKKGKTIYQGSIVSVEDMGKFPYAMVFSGELHMTDDQQNVVAITNGFKLVPYRLQEGNIQFAQGVVIPLSLSAVQAYNVTVVSHAEQHNASEKADDSKGLDNIVPFEPMDKDESHT